MLGGLRGESLTVHDLDAWRKRLQASPWVPEAATIRRDPLAVGRWSGPSSSGQPMGISAPRINGGEYIVDEHGVIIDQYGPQYADLDMTIRSDGLAAMASSDSLTDEGRGPNSRARDSRRSGRSRRLRQGRRRSTSPILHKRLAFSAARRRGRPAGGRRPVFCAAPEYLDFLAARRLRRGAVPRFFFFDTSHAIRTIASTCRPVTLLDENLWGGRRRGSSLRVDAFEQLRVDAWAESIWLSFTPTGAGLLRPVTISNRAVGRADHQNEVELRLPASNGLPGDFEWRSRIVVAGRAFDGRECLAEARRRFPGCRELLELFGAGTESLSGRRASRASTARPITTMVPVGAWPDGGANDPGGSRWRTIG